jgi:anti-sigma regulatory factor (Ser/Thr protein kinase)
MPYYRCARCGLTSYGAAAYTTARTCPNCAAALGDDARLQLAPGEIGGTDRVLPAVPGSVAEARREITGLPLPHRVRERLTLLVSELVTNAVVHGGDGDVRLVISMRPGRVHVSVHDGGTGFVTPASNVPDPLTVGGQGLVIVGSVADDWGIDCDADGCTVWCDVLVEGLSGVSAQDVTGAYVRELALELQRPAAARA